MSYIYLIRLSILLSLLHKRFSLNFYQYLLSLVDRSTVETILIILIKITTRKLFSFGYSKEALSKDTTKLYFVCFFFLFELFYLILVFYQNDKIFILLFLLTICIYKYFNHCNKN